MFNCQWNIIAISEASYMHILNNLLTATVGGSISYAYYANYVSLKRSIILKHRLIDCILYTGAQWSAYHELMIGH